MSIREKMNPNFRNRSGEIFSSPDAVDRTIQRQETMKPDILSWADPFLPDRVLPESVRKAMFEAIESGFTEHYAPADIKYELNRCIAERISRRTGLDIDPSKHVLVTPGSDSGLVYAMMPFIEPGDEVLVPDPGYQKYFLNPELLGGVTVPVPLYPEDNYQLRIDELNKRFNSNTKLLILCHPNNPTTTVFREENLLEISRFVIENDLVLLCDQAFEDHIFDGIKFLSPAALPGMRERTVTVCSTSKGYGLSGFRIGYLWAQEDIMRAYYAGAANVLGAASTLSIIAAAAAMKDPNLLASNYTALESRRRTAYDILSGTPGVVMKMPESGILSWLDVRALGSGTEVAAYLESRAGIQVNDGEQYGSQGAGHLRVVTGCYRDEETAAAVFRRMREALTDLAAEKGISAEFSQ